MAPPRKRSDRQGRARAAVASEPAAEPGDVAAREPRGGAEPGDVQESARHAAAEPATSARPAKSDVSRVGRDARGLVLLAVVASTLVGVGVGGGPLGPIRICGWTALSCLVLALACSPGALLFGRAGSARARRVGAALARARRGIGVSAFVLAALHVALALAIHLDFDLGAVVAIDRLRHGALALGLLTPLALTSSDRVVAALRPRAWKALHRAAYPAAILAAAHAFRGPFSPPIAVIAAAVVVTAVLVSRPVLALIRGRSAHREPDPS